MSFTTNMSITDIKQIKPGEILAKWPSDCLTASNKVILSHEATILFQMINPGEGITSASSDENDLKTTSFDNSKYYKEGSDPRSLPSDFEKRRICAISKISQILEEEAYIDEHEKQKLKNTISMLKNGSQDEINIFFKKTPIRRLIK
jgi:hypothetical protein